MGDPFGRWAAPANSRQPGKKLLKSARSVDVINGDRLRLIAAGEQLEKTTEDVGAFMKTSFAICLLTGLLLVTGHAVGDVTTIVDTTPGSATNDGIIGMGEYVGFSTGINGGFGNVIGSDSQLFVDSSSTGMLNFGLRKGGGGFNDVGVIYIDTGTGGLNGTAAITDNTSRGRAAISGNGEFMDSSELIFAPGFNASYAVALSYQFGVFAELYRIEGDGALTFVTEGNINPGMIDPSTAETEWEFSLGDLGLSNGDSFNFVATYLNSGNAFRSDEFHGVSQTTVPGGNIGNGGTTFTLAPGDFNTFVTVPEPTAAGLALALTGCAAMRRRRMR